MIQTDTANADRRAQRGQKVDKGDMHPVTAHDIGQAFNITQASMIGSEHERFVVNRDGKLIDQHEHDAIMTALKAAGLKVTPEPSASLLEMKTGAVPVADPAASLHQQDAALKTFHSVVSGLGYQILDTGYLGDLTLDQAIAGKLPSERLDGLLEYALAHGNHWLPRHALMTASEHVSVSPRDPDHMFVMTKILAPLVPGLTALYANIDGKFDRAMVAFNPSASSRLAYHPDTAGIPRAVVEATDANDLLRRHGEILFNTPMQMHYTRDAMLDPENVGPSILFNGGLPTLAMLQAHGLNTASNAALAESQQRHAIKLTSITNTAGEVCGKRIEIRVADAGPHQAAHLTVLAAGIAQSDDLCTEMAARLKHAGLDPFDGATGKRAATALTAVSFNRAGALAIPFGNGTVGDTMQVMSDVLTEHVVCAPSNVRRAVEAMDAILAEKRHITERQVMGNAAVFAASHPIMRRIA